MKTVADRNEQFEYIAALKAEYGAAGEPILSIDTKKKEPLGEFYRPGTLYTREVLHPFDHDFNSFATGVVIPHGIYDLQRNRGYLNLGTSRETSAFTCDSLRLWWYDEGQWVYPQASSLLLLCDGGGSNGCRSYLFKEDLQGLVDEIGREIRVAHYPPYTSKYNPIEHRLFPHLTKACKGVLFTSVELVKKLMEKTKTKTGLTVTVNILDGVYQTGRKVSKAFKEQMPILFDTVLPQWNYTVVPQ